MTSPSRCILLSWYVHVHTSWSSRNMLFLSLKKLVGYADKRSKSKDRRRKTRIGSSGDGRSSLIHPRKRESAHSSFANVRSILRFSSRVGWYSENKSMREVRTRRIIRWCMRRRLIKKTMVGYNLYLKNPGISTQPTAWLYGLCNEKKEWVFRII